MKPERNFVAERPLARHCPELLPAPVQADETPASLQAYGERLAEALAAGVAGLVGGEPKVTCSAPRADTLQDIALLAPRLAAWSLFDIGRPGAPLLTCLDGAAVFQLVDRAFGGTGALPEMLPDSFPLSADLFIDRIDNMVAAAIGEAMGSGGTQAVWPIARQLDPARLDGIAAGEGLAVLDFRIQTEHQPGWTLMLAVPQAARAILAGNEPMPSAASARKRHPANPANEPFGSMPLCVSAVLVDMAMGFSQLSGLRPGDILPVAVARKVPLRIGDQTIAHGVIGELDDRVAVRVTQAF